MSFDDIQDKLIILASQFGDANRTQTRDRPITKLEEGLAELQKLQYVTLIGEGDYILTEEGEEVGRLCVEKLERGAQVVRKIASLLLSPDAVAKVTILVDFVLASMKLLACMLTGSVALMADGADAAVDTVSAIIVWAGIRFNTEMVGTVVIILMMFFTAASIGYESATSIIDALSGDIEPISQPMLVIGMETFVLLVAVFLYTYQNYVGKKFGNLSLISQSVDSKNHIYVAGAVIAGALFSMYDFHLADYLIGAFIAFRIASDGLELTREVISRRAGEETDYSKYRTFLEVGFENRRVASFRNWILYTIKEIGVHSKEEIVLALRSVYDPGYVPIMTEFNLNFGREYDFESEFINLIQPLVEDGLVTASEGKYIITEKGISMMENAFRTFRFTSLHNP